MGDRKTIDEVAENLIDKVAEILDYRLGVALGHEPPEGYEKYNVQEQQRMLELAKPLIQKYESVRVINAKSTNDIIMLLSKGKITPVEAKQMMELLLLKSEVEDLEAF